MQFKPVVENFCFLEAPRVDERGIWFSDCALGGFYCLRPNGRIDSWLTDRKFIGGMAINDDGKIICGGPDGPVWCDPATGATGVLLDAINGEPLPGCNDMMPDGKGGLYFGSMNYTAIKNGERWGEAGIYRLDADGTVTELVGKLEFCNGIGLSPDGRKLYHNASMEGTIAYEILPDGSLSDGEMLNADKDCDGLAVDSEGGVWIALTHQGFLLRVKPDGTTDRRIEIPGGHVTSVCFGGSDWRDLYLTTTSEGAPAIVAKGGVPKTRTGRVLHAKSDIPGVPVAQTRFQLSAA